MWNAMLESGTDDDSDSEGGKRVLVAKRCRTVPGAEGSSAGTATLGSVLLSEDVTRLSISFDPR
jgi:hypothetical protein